MNVAGKSRQDFDRNGIIRVMQSALPRFVLRLQPVGTDDGQKCLARRHLIALIYFEVDSARNAVNAHEEIFPPECLR
jgi:hypothetical protein